MQLKFKMLNLRQIVPQIWSEDWFFMIDLKDAYFQIFYPSISQEVPEVLFRGQSIPISGSSVRPSIITPHFYEMHKYSSGASASSEYSHIELHRRLVNSSSVTSFGSSASRCRSCPHEIIRVMAKRQKRLWFPHFLHTCPRQVETTLVLVSGPGVESSMLPRNASDGCIPHRLGSGHEWPPCSRSLKRMSPRLAHQPTGDAGRVSGPETLSPRPKRLPCVGANRQHSGDLLHQPPSRSAVTPPVQAGAPDPCVVPGQTPLTESSLHPWVSQCGSRHPVETGAIARGMDASQQGGEADLESVWPGTGGPLRYSRDSAMSPLVLSSSSSSAGAGCHGTGVAEASSVCFSSDCPAPRSSGKSAPGRSPAAASSPVLARLSMVLGPDFSPRRFSLVDSRQEGSPLTGGRHPGASPPGVMETVGVAPEGTSNPPIQCSLNEETICPEWRRSRAR